MASSRRELGWRECAAILIGIAAISAVAAAFGHYDCHHVQANISSPEPGTTRANYCGTVDTGSGLAMFVVPLLIAAAAFRVVRRTDRVIVVACLIAGLAIANAVLIMLLNPEYDDSAHKPLHPQTGPAAATARAPGA